MSLARKKATPANRKDETVEDLISRYESEVAELEQVYEELQKLAKSPTPPPPLEPPKEEPKPPTPPPTPPPPPPKEEQPPKPPTPPPKEQPPKPLVPKEKVKKVKVVQYKKKAVEPPPLLKPPPKEVKINSLGDKLDIDESLKLLKGKEKKKKWTVVYYEDDDKTKEIRRESFSTNKSAAEILGCAPSTINGWARKGKNLKKPFMIIKNE